HLLPPLKRYNRLMMENSDGGFSEKRRRDSSCLPAKKRRRVSVESTPSLTEYSSYCLPAKKRVWGIRPSDLDLLSESPFCSEEICLKSGPHSGDLNLESDSHSGEFNLESDPHSGEPNLESSPHSEPPLDSDDDDDGIVCAVCGSTDGDPTDPIVFCDGCDLTVHSTCYGHPLKTSIPEGDWFCAQCLSQPKQPPPPPSCCLCPAPGGASKPTTDGRWAHLVCSIYVPEVFFSDPENREGIDCRRVTRWDAKNCYLCGSNNGCVIDCSEPKCPLSFHVTCGVKHELTMEFRQGKKNSGRGGGIVTSFCRSHTDLWKKQEHTGRFKIVARNND
ncbi:hypothetical protein M569_09086, partial [Genlisea aurea]